MKNRTTSKKTTILTALVLLFLISISPSIAQSALGVKSIEDKSIHPDLERSMYNAKGVKTVEQ
ncbi:hypothetical protein [Pedobacter metabolipauper]|uniref:hypothetical protein n=1 Tax=Pedobacter metabolipauper TaxID=425513 RepID=UPI00105F3661|nr:hypothetical protein [Pedobacter metabolipauper]